MTLVEFLRARLDEDEADAAAASPGPWHVNAEQDEVLAADGITVADGFALSNQQLRATACHIARHDPARILAEVNARREIVKEYAHYQDTDGLVDAHDYDSGWANALGLVVRGIAQSYTGHLDYDPAWME
ncbi:DUF6221 family protein [[Kitasatospora] papulosa]|uniref:DUF6221 family protein n=1 Tax=[Kitasatospora] papulosa TaxID=1464011 RepID=UPI0038575A08